MIKSNEGRVEINGKADHILADLSTLIRVLADNLPREDIEMAIKIGLEDLESPKVISEMLEKTLADLKELEKRLTND